MQVRGVEVLQVLEALERAPALVSDLVQELRMPAQEVKALLEALRRKGVVDRAESGFYYLVDMQHIKKPVEGFFGEEELIDMANDVLPIDVDPQLDFYSNMDREG
ncbi:hypothetical protein VFC49_06920 [Thermococcus sp. SY098]|uniref:MarR family transcriptional regulator n=1 Tax=Thermococcus sp. SY098 TaxID=3111325 RepID=UPI002D77127F|nr:hypothetical protein [Thermococcus sp. SY098]WRS51817.1 hypothetical protein VFC49_06920 [Thermococcus sp. SY098]